jgi:spore coat-associated protein N
MARMQNVSIIWKSSPRKLLVALGMLLAATAVALGSGANFNSTSANADNIFSAGSLAHSNSKSGAAILTAAKMKPGDSIEGTVDIKNTGDIAGTFTLAKSGVSDVPSSPALSAKLKLKIDDLGDPDCTAHCPVAAVRYDGTLADMETLPLGSFATSETHRYKFTVTFPDGGANGADNAYMGGSTTVQYDWTSVS